MSKLFAGARLRRLRDERGLSQRDLAAAVNLSASYVNQLENDQRPLTATALLTITSRFDLPADYFAPEGESRLVAEVRASLASQNIDRISDDAVSDFVTRVPEVARVLVSMQRRLADASVELDLYRSQVANATSASATPMPFEEVRDFFYDRQNYINELDRAAEQLAPATAHDSQSMRAGLTEMLRVQCGIDVAMSSTLPPRVQRSLTGNTLRLASTLTTGQQAFQIATQLALTNYGEVIDGIIDRDGQLSARARDLARIGLANYFAGAVVMPYVRFITAAQQHRYDVDVLAMEFGVSFETICHRLSTLQRPGNRGVPLIFVRTDRAGNVSKRQSATSFHFSRAGGGCPRWVVYDAVTQPDRIVTQIAAMPDGRRYLWMARAVSEPPGRYGALRRDFVIGLGCDIAHADRMVYGDGMPTDDAAAATPIGPGCKVCPRHDCAQRAFPYIATDVVIDENTSSTLPYMPRLANDADHYSR